MKTGFIKTPTAAETLAGLLIILLVLFCAPFARAQSTDGYGTQTDLTSTTNFNQVVFLGVPTKAIRLTSIEVNADTNIADLHILGGTTPVTVTNVLNVTNLHVASTAGVISNQLAILQRGVTQAWLVTVAITNNGTNITLLGGSTIGFTPAVGDVLWTTTNRYISRVPTGRTALTGEAIAAAQVRAPLALRLTPSLQSGTNKLTATAKYEQQ